jgi:hypothetical protein
MVIYYTNFGEKSISIIFRGVMVTLALVIQRELISSNVCAPAPSSILGERDHLFAPLRVFCQSPVPRVYAYHSLNSCFVLAASLDTTGSDHLIATEGDLHYEAA